ncbi:hypothetical protein L7F22_028600 [Adiantum nelumboides]|nr:hypothetical protein [Adiantum nelumboides]
MARSTGNSLNTKSPLEEEGFACRVLASLPLLDLLQMRGVCKLWRSLVGSRIVSEAWSSAHCSRDGAGGEEGSGAAPWFVMGVGCSSNEPGVDDQFAAFDTASHRWVPFEAFLSSTCSEAALLPLGGPSLTRVLHSLPTFRAAPFKAVGSDNGSGLVCFICRPAHTVSNDVPFSLVMLNPVTGAHTILPHPPANFYSGHLEVDRLDIHLQALPGYHYRVFLTPTSDFCCPGTMDIFDSRSGSWTAGRSWTAWSFDYYFDKDAKIGGAKELAHADLLRLSHWTSSIFAYSVDLDEWSRINVDSKKLQVRFSFSFFGLYPNAYKVFRHRGRVLLAAFQLQGRMSNCPEGFAVWELHLHANDVPANAYTDVAEWVEVARTPPKLWECLYGVDHDIPTCLKEYEARPCLQTEIIVSGGLICMTAYSENTSYAPLMYDLNRQVWYHLPPCKEECYDVTALFGFRPSLA